MPAPAFDIPVRDLIEASRRPEIVTAMRGFYEEVERRIAACAPTCWNSGACCKFGEYGHRLYVTTLEAAYYLATAPPAHEGRTGDERVDEPGADDRAAESRFTPSPAPGGPGRAAGETTNELARMVESPLSRGRGRLPVLIPPLTADVCPHAHDRQCQVRVRRPVGCRIFYCDPQARSWQGPFTEECLEELKRLHWELAVPYCYVDWMSVLRALREG